MENVPSTPDSKDNSPDGSGPIIRLDCSEHGSKQVRSSEFRIEVYSADDTPEIINWRIQSWKRLSSVFDDPAKAVDAVKKEIKGSKYLFLATFPCPGEKHDETLILNRTKVVATLLIETPCPITAIKFEGLSNRTAPIVSGNTELSTAIDNDVTTFREQIDSHALSIHEGFGLT